MPYFFEKSMRNAYLFIDKYIFIIVLLKIYTEKEEGCCPIHAGQCTMHYNMYLQIQIISDLFA